MRSPIAFTFTLAGALAVAACSGNSTPSTPAKKPTPTPTPTSVVTPTPTPTATVTPTPTPTPTPTGTGTSTPTPTPTPTTAAPQVVHIGFNHAETTDPTYGAIYFYALSATAPNAQIVAVAAGSKVMFVNDDPSGVPHTASGLGSSGFPTAFDNTSKFTQTGSAIDGGLTWSTGSLSHGATSQVFTVPAKGVYYFGCGYHYTTKPNPTNGSMGDVLVAS